MRAVQFFDVYFKNFGKLVQVNLLFFISVIISVAYICGTYILFKGLSIAVAAVCLIVLNVFMAGVTQCCRYIYENKEFRTVEAFFKGIKNNWKSFLLHGVIFYAVFIISYFSVTMYGSAIVQSSIFWVPLGITLLIVLFALFSFYYVNIMTVTLDIKLKDIYRNCMLFSFGELKNNILATIALLIFAAVNFTICVIFSTPVWLIVVGVLMTALIIPSTVEYIIVFYTYDSMLAMLDVNTKKERQEQTDAPAKPPINREEAENISRLAPDSKDEYVFHNGKMIKRSLVEEQLKDVYDD